MWKCLPSLGSLILLLFFQAAPLYAQEGRRLVTKNFQFADGVYQTFEAFQANTPTYQWEELRASFFTNPQTFLTQVEYLERKKETGTEPLNPEDVWGVVLGGIPYVRLPRDSVQKEMTSFAGLQVRGKICFFKYEVAETEEIEITAYNPANGRPFRKGKVKRKQQVWKEKMLDFQSGAVVDFNLENLKQWMQDDPHLLESVADMQESEANEKLFRILLIYVDRNPVYVGESLD